MDQQDFIEQARKYFKIGEDWGATVTLHRNEEDVAVIEFNRNKEQHVAIGRWFGPGESKFCGISFWKVPRFEILRGPYNAFQIAPGGGLEMSYCIDTSLWTRWAEVSYFDK